MFSVGPWQLIVVALIIALATFLIIWLTSKMNGTKRDRD
jgi:Sec-independent protein translocase protein TatA